MSVNPHDLSTAIGLLRAGGFNVQLGVNANGEPVGFFAQSDQVLTDRQRAWVDALIASMERASQERASA